MRWPWSRPVESNGYSMRVLPGRGVEYVREDGSRFNTQGDCKTCSRCRVCNWTSAVKCGNCGNAL